MNPACSVKEYEKGKLSKMKKAVTFGEIMLRLQPPSYERFLQAKSFGRRLRRRRGERGRFAQPARRGGEVRHPPARQSARRRLPQLSARLGGGYVGHRVRRRPHRHLFLRKRRVPAALQRRLRPRRLVRGDGLARRLRLGAHFGRRLVVPLHRHHARARRRKSRHRARRLRNGQAEGRHRLLRPELPQKALDAGAGRAR